MGHKKIKITEKRQSIIYFIHYNKISYKNLSLLCNH